MREIKFRGKSTTSGKWVHGMLTTLKDLGAEMQDMIIIKKEGVFNEGSASPFFMEWDYIHKDTVGQFTGLKDKSGKEIYEGDIISVNGKYPKLIRYIDEWASYCLANLTDLGCDLKTRHWQQVSPCWWTDYKREIKVIGNVYDNPELLKGGNDDHT
jgi:uncharacterized phage protein (TIGR01671 family)